MPLRHLRSPLILLPMESPYATCIVSIIVTSSYLARFPRYGGLLVQFLLSQGGCLCLTQSFGVNPKIQYCEIFITRNWKHTTIVRCKEKFDISKRLGMTHECDRDRGGQTLP